jgi:hypothetical protein
MERAMNRLRNGKRLFTASALALAMTGSSLWAADATTTNSSQPNLEDQIKSMQAQLDELKAAQKSQFDATVQDVTQDAQQRSQTLDSGGFTSGYANGKFLIQSDDGTFVLHPFLQFQLRNVTTYRNDAKTDGSPDTDNGWEVRRAKFGFEGTVYSPDLHYYFRWATSRTTGTPTLEEGYASYAFNVGLPDKLTIKGGEFKDEFAHEQLTSSTAQMAAERTLLNDIFTGGDDYVEGGVVLYNAGNKGGPIRGGISLTNGTNNENVNFQDPPTNKWDYGIAARAEYKVFGDWSAYDQFSSLGLKNPLLVVGGGLSYSEAGDFNQVLETADAQFNTGPIGLFGALYGRNLANAGVGGAGTATPSPAKAGTANFFDSGFIAQASYLFTKQWEAFGRYSYVHFDGGEFPATAGHDNVDEITIGANYYLYGQNAKVTTDLTYLPNGTPIADTGADILASKGSEYVLRVQFQLLI